MTWGVKSKVEVFSREEEGCRAAEDGAAFFDMPAPSCVVVPTVPDVDATGEANVELAAAAIVQVFLAVWLFQCPSLDAITCVGAFVSVVAEPGCMQLGWLSLSRAAAFLLF